MVAHPHPPGQRNLSQRRRLSIESQKVGIGIGSRRMHIQTQALLRSCFALKRHSYIQSRIAYACAVATLTCALGCSSTSPISRDYAGGGKIFPLIPAAYQGEHEASFLRGFAHGIEGHFRIVADYRFGDQIFRDTPDGRAFKSGYEHGERYIEKRLLDLKERQEELLVR